MKERPYQITMTEGGESYEHYLVRNEEARKEWRKKNKTAQNIGLLAIALFWKKDYCDYAAVTKIDDQGEESWIRVFGQQELVDWMAGFTLTEERRKLLHHANREKGSFVKQWGWRPDTVVEWEPSEQELEAFIDWELKKDEEPNGTLYIPKEG